MSYKTIKIGLYNKLFTKQEEIIISGSVVTAVKLVINVTLGLISAAEYGQ